MGYNTAIVSCPKCGHHEQINLLTSCNSLFEVEERKAILNKSAFSYKCSSCGQICKVIPSCVYTNPVNKFYIYLDSKENLSSYNVIPGYSQMDSNGYRHYGATSPSDLINKILSLEYKEDPRIAELAIDLTLERFNRNFPKEDMSDCFLFVDNENNSKLSIAIIVGNGTRFYSSPYPFGDIKRFNNGIKSKIKRVKTLYFDRDDFLSIKDWTYSNDLFK